MSWKGWVGPIAVGVVGGIAALFVGWWGWLVLAGFAIGWFDRAPLFVRKGRS